MLHRESSRRLDGVGERHGALSGAITRPDTTPAHHRPLDRDERDRLRPFSSTGPATLTNLPANVFAALHRDSYISVGPGTPPVRPLQRT
ncbi:MAG: hypothetical protein HY650_04205 [Acidobacteria bacterium]|nr:hypothetical protein [Acidobacteriota bacterium]